MSKFVPLNRKSHAHLRWNRASSFTFAAQMTTVPVVAAELPKAMMAFPIGFIREKDGFMPAALLGTAMNPNVFVLPDGRWVGGYIPSALRGHPFHLMSAAGNQLILCVDEQSSAIGPDLTGDPLFDEDGKLASGPKEVLNFLSEVESNRAATAKAARLLEQHGVIQPWTQTSGGVTLGEGLFKADEKMLNGLSMEAFQELRQGGALVLAYCQMLSMQHVALLAKLGEMQVKAQRSAPSAPPLQNIVAPADDGDLMIDWSQFNSGPSQN